MIKIADVYETRNGKKKVVFFLLGIYDLLKEKLGFKYTVIKKKGYYLKSNNGGYEIVNFHTLRSSFSNYLKNEFESIQFNLPIEHNEFMNEYYRQLPVKNGNYAREYLSEDFALTDEDKDLLLQKTYLTIISTP